MKKVGHNFQKRFTGYTVLVAQASVVVYMISRILFIKKIKIDTVYFCYEYVVISF